MKRIGLTVFIISSIFFAFNFSSALEKRDDVSFLRGPYNGAFFHRHNNSFRESSALHFAHGKQHDVLILNPLSRRESTDRDFLKECLDMVARPPRTEPKMEYFGPWSARTYWQLYRAIDWTHMHHEQTYDILSAKRIPWAEKKRWTDRAVRYYLDKLDIPRSPAPLDVTMRRAAVMMKPYFTYFRNNYPGSNNFFYGAHWWHPVVYEAIVLGGPGEGQEKMLRELDATYKGQVLTNPPLRMLLSREVMPRYSRLSPESANIFDNLHMLHGIAYDILAYEGWTDEQKKAELYRVIRAMSYQPGDEMLARKFRTPHPDIDPRVYSDWMRGTDGEMNRIMAEMMEEMMPMTMPGMKADMKQMMMEQFKMKLAPGMQKGEVPGSLMDAMKALMPEMKMSPDSMEPGTVSEHMVRMMKDGWNSKYGKMADIETFSLSR